MDYRKTVSFATTALVIMGLLAFYVMPREEDPRIQRRNAVARVLVPGANPDRILRQVVRPLEDELEKVEELKKVLVEARLNVALFQLELVDGVKDLDRAWREVERALDRASESLPQGVQKPILDFGVLEIESIIFAIKGGEFPEMIDGALGLRDEFLKNSQVAEVRVFGNPELEIRTEVDEKKLFDLGLTIPQVLRGIAEKNAGTQTGFILQQGSRIALEQANDLALISELEELTFETRNFKRVKLSEFSTTLRTTQDPPNALFRWNGVPAIGIGLVAREGLNIESFGDAVMEKMTEYQKKISPLKLDVVAYQPQRTSDRISELVFSLLSGMLLIGLILLFFFGAATSLLVTLMVPVISLIGLFVYFLMGGVLHQISIAAFIISIGQFIDNIVVVIDQMQRRINGGVASHEAAVQVATELKIPLAFATLTGICAFLPMLSAQGSTADFVVALPTVAIITLISSYFVTIFFTPIISASVLKVKPPTGFDRIFKELENIFSRLALGPIWRVGALVLFLIGLSVVGLIQVQKEFFPESDRNEFLFTFELGPSSDINATLKILKEIEKDLGQRQEVRSFAAFAGGDIPRFYYNLPNFQRSPHVGQVLITVNESVDLKSLGLELESQFASRFPESNFNSIFLQQGPPINAKFEIRFFSESPDRLAAVREEIHGLFKRDSRLRSVRADETQGLRSLRLATREKELAAVGLTSSDLNSLLAFYSTGILVSKFRHEREALPLRIRAHESLEMESSQVLNSLALRGRDRDFLLSDFVTAEPQNIAPVIRRQNSQGFIRVLADLKPGFTFSDVIGDIKSSLNQISIDERSERFEMGGDAEGAGEANLAILKVVPAAMVLLILFLLLEFKSYRKVLIAAVALPITIMGVFPGLWLAGAPFGFMSLLGVLALVGISVNNIILLLEALNETGEIESAIRLRIRAIFLTSILTLAGLLPLALDDSSLWPPLAWTMISGLLTGTVVTLIVVPVLYRIFFRKEYLKSLALIFFSLLASNVVPPEASAQEQVTLTEALKRVERTAEYRAAKANLEKDQATERANYREVWLPKAQLLAEAFQRPEDIYSKAPFGQLKVEEQKRLDLKLELQQKIFDWSSMNGGRQAAIAELEASEQKALQQQAEIKHQKAKQMLGLLKLKTQLDYLNQLLANLKKRSLDTKALLQRGRVSQADLLKLEVLISRTEQVQKDLKIEMNRSRTLLESDGILKSSESLVSASIQEKRLANLREFSKSLRVQRLQSQARSFFFQKERMKALAIPQFSVFARGLLSQGRNLAKEDIQEYGIRMFWEIPIDGTRNIQAKSFASQGWSLEHSSEALSHQERAEHEMLLAKIATLQEWKLRLSEIARKANLVHRSEESKFSEGRISLSDLIESDTLRLELRRDLELADQSLLEYCVDLEIIKGHEVLACQ